MYILGISAFYHDSAAALLKDGKVVAAAQEERFTRKKHDPSFPEHAIRYCLKEAGVDARRRRSRRVFEKPLLKFERLLETYLANAPRGFQSFRMAMPVWLKEKLFQKAILVKALKPFGDKRELDGQAAVRRAPPEPRRVRVLPLALRGGGRADHGRRRRMGDDVGRDRPRQRRWSMLREIHLPHSSACSTRRSPTTPGSRSTPASTR